MQQRKSAIIIHMPPPCLASLPFPIPSLQIIAECQAGFPVLHGNFSVLSLLRLIEYTCWCYFLHLSHSLSPPLCPQVHFLYLDLIKVKSFCTAKETISSVQLLNHVQLFAAPWTAACQASLSITNSQSLLKLMAIKSVMPSNYLILCHPLLLPPSVFPSIRIFSWRKQ